MACFLVPLTEAVVLTAGKIVASKINTNKVVKEAQDTTAKVKIFGGHSGTLLKMLYGGSFLLAAEHIFHGEVTFLPPFLTALNTPEEVPVMLHEMATAGVAMAVLTTAVWAIGLGISYLVKKRKNALVAA